MVEENKNGEVAKIVMEKFRIITPILVTIAIFFIGGISLQIKTIDTKLFTHLTNHELHVPRGIIVTKGEFDMHCMESNRGRVEVVSRLDKIDNILVNIYKELK